MQESNEQQSSSIILGNQGENDADQLIHSAIGLLLFHKIVTEPLLLRKLSTRWVPKELTPEYKIVHGVNIDISEAHLKKFLSGQCQHFQNDRGAEMSVTHWFQSQAADFCDTGIQIWSHSMTNALIP